jgi:hypothetical protein
MSSQQREPPAGGPPIQPRRPPETPTKRRWNGWDVLLWLACWPWAVMRLIGRHAGWSASASNWAGVGAGVAVIVVAALVSGGSSTATGTRLQQGATATGIPQSAAQDAAPESDPARGREARDPNGKLTSSCDFLMPDDVLSGAYSFFAVAKLRNTGNVGLKAKVTAVFDQVSGDDLKVSRVVRVKVHTSRTVKLSLPATQHQVDKFQNSPEYLNGDACRVHSRIVDSFGRPPLEKG